MAGPRHTEREQRLNEVVASYLKAIDAGQQPNRRLLLAKHPELEAELKSFFANQDWGDRLAPFQGQAPAPAPAAPTGGMAATDLVYLNPAKASRHPVQPGTVFAGRFRVFGVKSGGMGRVYLADDLKALKNNILLKVAIKSVVDFDEWQELRWANRRPADEADYAALLTRFHREALAWVRLGAHENIILALMVHDVGGKPYLVMEYADSGDLSSWIKDGRVTMPLAVNFALQFCAGMQHAATISGLVHRDIKPANVLIKDNRILKITDFGLAKAFGPDAVSHRAAGDPGGDGALSEMACGTPAYMPPEQFEGLARADTRSDIYSFGAMLFEMLTRRPLFVAGSWPAHRALRAKPITVQHLLDAHVPPALAAIIARCAAGDPGARYPSFAELAQDLRRVQEALPDRLPLPKDTKSISPEQLTPSLQMEGEAYSLISLGRFAEAAQSAQKGIDLDPTFLSHWVNKGKALMELKDYDGALRCTSKAVELDPGRAHSWSNLGWAKLALGDPRGGLEAAQRAIWLDAELGEAWTCRGCCERELGRRTEAVESLRVGTDLEPHNWNAHANLGFCLLELDRHAEAREALGQAIKLNPGDALCWYQMAYAHAATGSWTEALAAVDKCLELEPGNSDAWAMRALILWESKRDRPAALACLDKAFALDPANVKARSILQAVQ